MAKNKRANRPPSSLTVKKTICVVTANRFGFEFRVGGAVLNFISTFVKELWGALTIPFYYHLGEYSSFWTLIYHLEDYALVYVLISLLTYTLYVAAFRSDSLMLGLASIKGEWNRMRSVERSLSSVISYVLNLVWRAFLWVVKAK